MEIGISLALLCGLSLLAAWLLRVRTARVAALERVSRKRQQAVRDNASAVQLAIRGRR